MTIDRTYSTGLWFRRPLGPAKLVAVCRDLRLSAATLVSNAGVAPLHINRWPTDDLAESFNALEEDGVDVDLMTWPIATALGVDELLTDLDKVKEEMASNGADLTQVELDAEGKYNNHGWGPAGVHLAKPLAQGLKALGMTRVSVTCITTFKGPRPQDIALVLALIDAGLEVIVRIQGYTQLQPGKEWTKLPQMRPGVLQSIILEQWVPLAKEHGFELVMGLIGAFQDHPGDKTDGIVALHIAHDTALATGDIEAIHVWDHNILASYAERYLREAPYRTPSDPYKFEDTGTMHDDSLDKADVKELQQALSDAGYSVGVIDGLFGPRTKAAAEVYRRDSRGIAPDDFFDPDALALIDKLLPTSIEASA